MKHLHARRLLTVAAVLCTVSPLWTPSASAFTDAETCTMAQNSDGSYHYSCLDSEENGYTANHTHAATFFTETGYAGKKLEVWKLGGDCTATYSDNEWDPILPSSVSGWPNWRNNIESLHTFNQCDVKLYWNPPPDTSPASVWIDDSSNLNTLSLNWNNQADWFRLS
jgi:hypothetical protein